MQAARQCSSATSGPLVIRRNAEAAATEAYRRAQPAEPPICPDYRPAPAMLHRRRSQVTGRSEGSHLEDARLGRRRSTARREEVKSTPLPRQRPHSEYVSTVMKENKTRAKKTTFVQPQSTACCKEALNPVATSHYRDSPFEYSSGSPAARTTSAKSEVRGSSIPQTPRNTDKSYDDGISVTYTEPQPYATRTKAEPHMSSRRVSIRETQTDEEIIALARNRQLQESQQHKLRERKSFFGSLQMLQKRDRPSDPPGIVYDSSLPPFNYADDSLIGPLPPTHDVAPTVPYLDASVVLERKTRAFSISVKGKFKKLLRKASRAPSGLMMQHAGKESNSHLIVDHDDLVGIETTSVLTDPFVVHGSPVAPRLATGKRILSASNDGNASIDGESAADRSRVTSWTNSTAAGTSSTYANTASTSVADEHGRLVSDKSHPALRKKSSFFGRAVQNRLRKLSRADLKSSEDSQALFTALRERILPQDENADQAESNASLVSRTSSALSTNLPSQKRAESLASSVRATSLTIRTVSPDMNHFQIQTMSPVVEASPERDVGYDEAADHTPTADHYGSRDKRVLVQADPPSPERIARRVQQSQARWKSALHGNSASSNGKVASAYGDDNPYELPSLGHNSHADIEVDTGGLPRHARVHAPPAGFREGLLSPSVYSRATDGASPQPVTPEPSGTRVTVTSREVKRYDISPSKKNIVTAQRPIHASSEWRKWLSDEMTSLAVQNEVDSLDMPQQPQTSLATSTVDAPGRRRAATNGSGSQRPSTDTPSNDQASKGRKGSRPRANSRRSSYMNERYPMVESSGNSSRRTSRKCSMGSNAGTDTERSLQIPGSDDSKHSVNGTVTSSKSGASKLLPKRHSLANLESLSKSKQPFTSIGTESASDRSLTSAALPGQNSISTSYLHPPTHHKHKSAFDLRAKYKSNVTNASRPLEVRRKTTVPLPITVFEDNTIQNISAGPYATASAPNANANNKENTPPHIVEDGGLPALSSSEWLAGPTSKKRDPKARPKSSPPKSGGLAVGNGNGREGSPGQRLVTGWLEGRKGKGGDGEAAFV
jgi:hypothetical protein